MEKFFPGIAHLIRKTRWVIPALHIQNHKDYCMYRFGSAYLRWLGHFYGETAEHYWAELNQVGTHTRQMNSGHRHDTINDHHGDWNWKKMANMCTPFSLRLHLFDN